MARTNVTRDYDGKTIWIEHEEAQQADTTARARRVILVNSSGDTIKSTQIEESRVGSDCSGGDGATGRVLTLQNPSASGNPTSVWVEEQLIAVADRTVSHSTSADSSTITFGGVSVYDTDTIKVSYYV